MKSLSLFQQYDRKKLALVFPVGHSLLPLICFFLGQTVVNVR